MGTLVRTGIGLAIGGVSLAVLVVAGAVLYRGWQDAANPAANTRVPKERSYAVTVATLEAETVVPVITTYGHLTSGRTLELRAAVAGPLLGLSENFRDGGTVAEGEILFRIDPARLETARDLARTDLAEAVADLAEARATLALAKLEVEAAQVQLDLRAQAVTRQEGLRDRGVATEADVETAGLARAAAEQALVSRRQVVAGDDARVAQAEITVRRREIALAEASRLVDEAQVSAPFAGVVSAVSAIQGRLVSVNEQLGVLTDPGEIEVSFRVTNNQYARLLNADGALRKADVTVVLQRGRTTAELAAKIDRAVVGLDDGEVGRLVYARLTEADPNLVQPGDFVTLRIPEPPLDNVARIPAAAATADGRILLIGAGDRLEEVQVTPLRHQDDELIVSDAPFGRQYVVARALQLGPGIQVVPVMPVPAEAAAQAAQAAPADGAAPAADTIALDDERRARIIAFIEASEQMKPEMREKFLEELKQPEVPRATVEKFEAKISESAQ